MPLSVGERLGSYQILALIGAGGMGEVYRARDTKLDRDVAIKVLPAALANNPERMARFQREAKVLAALNHPNIAAIYGLEDHAIVMELVDGPTLADRLQAGRLELNEALGIASAISDALEAAHDKGIVHRDLKPANVKAPPDGTVKVLDFGLATAIQATARDSSDMMNSPTLTMGATEVGMILGTAAYMSPEQAAGKQVDRRADIWSFGVVLWEMLTGKRLFDGGETVSHTLADVLRAQIDLERLPAATPGPIRELVKRCLDRNVKTRLRDIGEARVVIQQWLSNPEPLAAKPELMRQNLVRWIGRASVSVLILTSAALAFVHFREKAPVPAVMRFQIPAPEKASFAPTAPSISPDGKKLAFVAFDAGGHRQLWIRSLDTLEARAVPGTDDVAGYLIWSPDSRSIAFTVPPPVLKLKRIEVAGGPAQTLCDISNPAFGAWNRDGTIIFRFRTGLIRVSQAGGACMPLTALDAKRGELRQTTPSFLPDGKHFVYLRVFPKVEDTGIYIGSLDLKPEQQSSQRLSAAASGAIYAASSDSSPGYLLFLREGTLMAQRFDPDRQASTGEAIAVAEQVGTAGDLDGGLFSVSDTGVLAYRSGLFAGNSRLAWYDRSGKPLSTTETGNYNSLALSPDGLRVAVERNDARTTGGNWNIWVHEFVRQTETELTFDPTREGTPVWSGDAHVIYRSERDGNSNLYQKAASGAGDEEVLLKSSDTKYPLDVSRDGRYLLYDKNDVKSGEDLWVLPLQGERRPRLVLSTQFQETTARFSPDGRFIAYTSNSTGRNEVYVMPFSPDRKETGLWTVSKDGGTQPLWSRDGKELFFISGDSKVMAVPVTTGPTFKAGNAVALFTANILGTGTVARLRRWDIAPDGKRFITISVAGESASAPITVVSNWQTALTK